MVVLVHPAEMHAYVAESLIKNISAQNCEAVLLLHRA